VALHTMGTTILLELDKIGSVTENDQTAGLS
jgi:transcriptional antiterminator Rof (Rho-off)